MKVNFNLRTSTPNDKPQPINAVIRWNAQRLVYSTSSKVKPKHWNADKQRVKNVIDEPSKDKINSYLNNFESLVAAFDADQRAKFATVNTSDLKKLWSCPVRIDASPNTNGANWNPRKV